MNSIEPHEYPSPQTDPWVPMRATTQARIGLGSVGTALPTRQALALRADHAAARDAVHEPLNIAALTAQITAFGASRVHHVRSRAVSRSDYLRRPDLGRTPHDLSTISTTSADVGIVLADGLSPRALGLHGAALLEALLTELADRYTVADPVIATQARVALGDHIAVAQQVATVLVVIGERPGLSVTDSLGIYLTHAPSLGLTDANRNCISNIHPPDGLSYAAAARTARLLVDGANALGRSGIDLKDADNGPHPGKAIS